MQIRGTGTIVAVCDTCGTDTGVLFETPVRVVRNGVTIFRNVWDEERPFVCAECLEKDVVRALGGNDDRNGGFVESAPKRQTA